MAATNFGLLLLVALLTGTVQAAAVYRCDVPDAPPLFSDKPCASAHQLQPVLKNRFSLPALKPEQRQQLQRLRHRVNNPPKRAKTPKTVPATAANLSICAEQRDALRTLQQRRRKGYRLAEVARLEQTEQKLRQQIRLHC